MKNERSCADRASEARSAIQRNREIHPYLKDRKDFGSKEPTAPKTAKPILVKDMK